MRTGISLRWNPRPLYVRLKVGLGLTVLAGFLLSTWALGLGHGIAPRNTSGFEKASSPRREHSRRSTRLVEGLALMKIDPPKSGACPVASPVFQGGAEAQEVAAAPVLSAQEFSFFLYRHTPHSFLPFGMEARLGRSALRWNRNSPSSSVPSRLPYKSRLSALGPAMPLALAITQAVRPMPYPVLCREFLDQALNVSKPEAGRRASAHLAVTGTPDS